MVWGVEGLLGFQQLALRGLSVSECHDFRVVGFKQSGSGVCSSGVRCQGGMWRLQVSVGHFSKRGRYESCI